MKLLSGTVVTIVVAIAAYLLAVNAFHPWLGLRLIASSDLESGVALTAAAVAAVVCGWRLIKGVSPVAELRRLGDAVGRSDDLS